MKKLLLIQSRETLERIRIEQENYHRTIGAVAEIACVSVLDEGIAWHRPQEVLESFDGVIFGGSSDFDFHGGRPDHDPVRAASLRILERLSRLVEYAVGQQIPLLGVCFGHQLVANVYAGEVHHDSVQSKFGTYEVVLSEEGKTDPILSQLPSSFHAQYAHHDSVSRMPRGATLLASSPNCRFSILRYGPRAYTVQFHPELEHFEGYNIPVKPSPQASRLIPLWVEYIV